MEKMDERRVWQRVRGEQQEDPAAWLRRELSRQAALAERYRSLCRRSGRFSRLYERKRSQVACLRGLLRLTTGQPVAPPRAEQPAPVPSGCFAWEREFYGCLMERAGEGDPVLSSLAEQQRHQCRELLEALGEG